MPIFLKRFGGFKTTFIKEHNPKLGGEDQNHQHLKSECRLISRLTSQKSDSDFCG